MESKDGNSGQFGIFSNKQMGHSQISVTKGAMINNLF